MKAKYLGLMILLNIGWAATLPINKALGAWLSTGGIVSWRFILASLVLLALWPFLPGKAPRGGDLARAAGMGILVFCLGQRLQVLGNAMGTAGNSAVLMALEPLLTSLLAAIFLREQIAARRGIGFLLGMAGVVLLNGVWRPEFQWTSLAASLIFMSSFLSEAGYSVIGKPLAARAGSAKILACALWAGTLVNLAWDGDQTLATAAALPWQAWLMLGYMAVICTVVGYTVWLVVIKETDVNIVALTIFVQPLAGVPMAAIWLGEPLHWGQLWGCLAIAAGLVEGLWNRKKPAQSAPSTTGQANG